MILDGYQANEMFTQENDEPMDVPEVDDECEECFHPKRLHGPKGCTADRTIEEDGIEIDGPCGCSAVEVIIEEEET